MHHYITLSLETHLFFARIMKEHALFLEAGFPCKNEDWIRKSEFFRQQFEELLLRVVKTGNANIGIDILKSGELLTKFTIPAENTTERLSGISINSRISEMEQQLRAGCSRPENRLLLKTVHQLNQHSIQLLDGFIALKETILSEVHNQNLFTANYPLLIEHILREAQLYRSTITELMQKKHLSSQNLCEIEDFWNQIMMEHALFIRGLLDPSEAQLTETANRFAMDYQALLIQAKQQECRALEEQTRQSFTTTLKLRDFKTAGTEGILEGSISSIILPLLADHVLREANHYLRILEQAKRAKGGFANGTV